MRQLLMFGLLVLSLGCGQRAGPPRAAVTGTVTLDGVDIAEGSIALYPLGDVKGSGAGGSIKDGHYSLGADRGPSIGRNRVEIHAAKKSGRKVQAPLADPGVMTDEMIEAVPARYNSDSTLECDVKSGDNILDFTLTAR
jgi:hypothetical protein